MCGSRFVYIITRIWCFAYCLDNIHSLYTDACFDQLPHTSKVHTRTGSGFQKQMQYTNSKYIIFDSISHSIVYNDILIVNLEVNHHSLGISHRLHRESNTTATSGVRHLSKCCVSWQKRQKITNTTSSFENIFFMLVSYITWFHVFNYFSVWFPTNI